MYTCPGRENADLRLAIRKCPECGAEVEMFSSEAKVKCSECGQIVYRERVPSCIDWCASARQCLGEERWRQWRDHD